MTDYCSDTCGSNYKLQMRSCTPSSPNLPEGLSCASIPENFTLQASTEKCDLAPCKGKRNSKRKILCATFIQGDFGEWGDWSQCSANCTLGENDGEKRRERNLKADPSHEPDVQVQPCDGHCRPGIKLNWNHCIELSLILPPKIAPNSSLTFGKCQEVHATK